MKTAKEIREMIKANFNISWSHIVDKAATWIQENRLNAHLVVGQESANGWHHAILHLKGLRSPWWGWPLRKAIPQYGIELLVSQLEEDGFTIVRDPFNTNSIYVYW